MNQNANAMTSFRSIPGSGAGPSAGPPSPAGDDGSERAWCLVRNGAQRCAIALGAVEAIVADAPCRPLPLSASTLRGLMVFHREIVPVARPHQFEPDGAGTVPDAEAGAGANGRGPTVIVLRGEQGAWGLSMPSDGGIEVAPVGAATCRGGVVERDGTHYPVLDVEAIWRSVRRDMDQAYNINM